MPSWKKVLVSGSNAHLNHVTSSGNFSASLNSTGSFGDIIVGATENSQFYSDFSSSIQSRVAASEAGGVTGVTAGTGISGGGTSGTVTVNVDFSDSTFNTNVSGSWRGELSSSAMTDVGGGVTGSSTSTGSFGHLKLGNVDTDASFEFGRAHIGHIGYSDMAGFSHVDNDATSDFALAQSAAGKTIINAKSGQPIAFKINNSDKVQINSSGDLGIGIETALHKLHVVGNGFFTGDVSGSLASTVTFGNYGGNISGSSTSTGSFGRVELTTIGAFKAEGAIDFNNENMTNVDIDSGTITGITDLAVADGGTGASTFTDGGVLLGSGTDAITAMAALGDGEMIVGDGSTDPVAESGATLRTSIGVGTTDDVMFANITGSNDISASGDLSATGNLDIDGTSNLEGDVTLQNNLAVTGNITGSNISASSNLFGTLQTAAQTNITSVGALDAGSITSNFGTINNGGSAITTTGLISGGSLDIDDVLINGTTIGHTDDTDLLTVADGELTLDGKLTATGNVSSSLASTGSFGRLVTTGYGNVIGGQQAVPNLIIKNNYGNIDTSFGGGDTYQLSLYGNGGNSGNFEVKYGIGTTYNHWMKIMGNGGNDGTLDIYAGSDSNGLGKVSIMRTGVSASLSSTGSFGRVELTTIGAFKAEGAIDFNNENMTNVDIDSGTITGITDLAVADGGTGASTLTDGGILLGSGTDAITAMSVLGDGEMIVGDGSTDPVAESGATLRTSIGVGTTDTPTFAGLNTTGDIVIQGSLTANSYIVSSSVTHLTSSFSSGSTIFGDDTEDTHQFTGSLFVTSTPLTIDTDGSVSGSSTSTGSFGSLVVADKVQGDTTFGGQISIQHTTGTLTIQSTDTSNGDAKLDLVSDNGATNEDFWSIFNEGTDNDLSFKNGNHDPLMTIAHTTGHLTTTGSIISNRVNGVISGSSTSTGSFGSVVTVGKSTFGESTFSGQLRIPDGSVTEPSIVFTSDDDGGGTGIYRGGTNNIRMTINGTKAFELDASRNLDIDGDITTTDGTFSGDIVSTKASGVISGSSTSTGSFGHVHIPDGLAGLGIGNADDLQLYHDGSNSYIKDNGTGNIFYRGGTQTFQNAAGSKTMVVLNAANSVDLNYNNATKFQTTGDGISVTGELRSSAGATITGSIYISGSLGGNDGAVSASGDIVADGDIIAYNASDRELKDNLQVIQGSLDKIGEINGYEFDWNDKSPGWARERGHDVGVVAQEVQKILPEVVTKRKNGYLGVDYKRIVPLLIESIKELKQEVEELKKKVN